MNTFANGLYLFSFRWQNCSLFDGNLHGTNPRVKKVLIREYNRYELTTIRLDDGRFIRPLTDENRRGGKISWSDFVMLTECAAAVTTAVKYID